jgi:hypothetical protein
MAAWDGEELSRINALIITESRVGDHKTESIAIVGSIPNEGSGRSAYASI